MLIIAHRGNVNGPGSIDIAECADRGWGIELDLRWDQGKAYFNHEPKGHTPETDAKTILELFNNHTIAVNIKEIGNEVQAAELLRSIQCGFAFDMELIGADPELYPMAQRAVRISDRTGENDPNKFSSGVIWLDEFKPWVVEETLDALYMRDDLPNFKVVYWVSPELHRPVTTTQEFTAMEARWEQMYDWGVDGICTDYPKVLASRMEEWGTPQDPNYRASQLSESPIG